MTYREIEKEYSKYGYKFVQAKREGLIAIYEQRDADTDKLLAYEVFEIQQLPEQYVGPKRYLQPPREVPPGSETWGRLGFTCHTMKRAEHHFKYLAEKLHNREPKKEKGKKKKNSNFKSSCD